MSFLTAFSLPSSFVVSSIACCTLGQVSSLPFLFCRWFAFISLVLSLLFMICASPLRRFTFVLWHCNPWCSFSLISPICPVPSCRRSLLFIYFFSFFVIFYGGHLFSPFVSSLYCWMYFFLFFFLISCQFPFWSYRFFFFHFFFPVNLYLLFLPSNVFSPLRITPSVFFFFFFSLLDIFQLFNRGLFLFSTFFSLMYFVFSVFAD